jgi:hypothetical protein
MLSTAKPEKEERETKQNFVVLHS